MATGGHPPAFNGMCTKTGIDHAGGQGMPAGRPGLVRRRRRPYDVCLHPPRFERLLRLLFRRRQPVLPRRGRSPCARPALKSLGRPPAHARPAPPPRSPRPRRLRAGACSGRRGGRGRIRPPARIRRRRPAGRRCRGGFSRPPERGAVRSVARGRRRLELRDGPPRGASRGRRRRIRPPARIRRRRPSSSKSRCWGGGGGVDEPCRPILTRVRAPRDGPGAPRGGPGRASGGMRRPGGRCGAPRPRERL